jgi:hypothetical protein
LEAARLEFLMASLLHRWSRATCEGTGPRMKYEASRLCMSRFDRQEIDLGVGDIAGHRLRELRVRLICNGHHSQQ